MNKTDAILQATMKLIVEKGLHAVTFADISEAASVGMGAIYHRFDSKESIVQQIWIEQKNRRPNLFLRLMKIRVLLKSGSGFCGKR